MSENCWQNGDCSNVNPTPNLPPSSGGNSPNKPPRPPPPKFARPSSIDEHLEHLRPLKPERVRWFWKEDKKWVPFNGCDSLAIESCYRHISELELKVEDPTKPLNSPRIYDLPTVKGRLYKVDVVARECTPIYWKGDAVPVCRGTWFIGNLPDSWQPISENDGEQIDNSHQTLWRSLGFQVEGHEMEANCAAEKQGLAHLQLKGYHVIWNDMTEVVLRWDGVTSKIIRGLGERIGLSSGTTPLHRGYHTEASADDKPPEVTHMVFVVHGIGQLLHMSNIVKSCEEYWKYMYLFLSKNVGLFQLDASPAGVDGQPSLRGCAARVIEKHEGVFPVDGRMEFFPVEWRTSLKLDEGTIESITPQSVSGLRKVLNTSMMDIMYYTSPFYRYEIIDGVRSELNRIYDMFCSRNVSFLEKQGKVSLLVHSLGSVITYDILSLWDIEERHLVAEAATGTGFLTESINYFRTVTSFTGADGTSNGSSDDRGRRKENIRMELAKARTHVTELEARLKSEVKHWNEVEEGKTGGCPMALHFKVENMFCVGSPLGVFLTLRGIKPGDDDVEDHVLPRSVCKKMFNIYHPADPVAYRIEPLISEDYTSIEPVKLHRFDSTKFGYNEQKKPSGSGWAGKLFKTATVGFKKTKQAPERQSSSSAEEGESTGDEGLVIVDQAPLSVEDQALGAEGGACSIDGASGTDKKTPSGGWLSGWFGKSLRAETAGPSGVDKADGHPDDTKQGTTTATNKPNDHKQAEHVTVPRKVLSYRIDHVLNQGYMESNYWSAVTSHVAYWSSNDVVRFMLEHCFPSET